MLTLESSNIKPLVKFILNEREVNTALPKGILLLDFIRYHKNLMGTKIGCREGDCGACTILLGELKNGELVYQSVTSCLTPIGNAHGKHVVTIEGINMAELNAIQQAMVDTSGSQCGFCTPGFIMSMAGFCLSDKPATKENAIAAIDGNICRCTGYKSIERAAYKVATLMQQKGEADTLDFVAERDILPAYFRNIKSRLQLLSTLDGVLEIKPARTTYLGGGTDLYVQKHEAMVEADINFMLPQTHMKQVYQQGNRCIIGGASTVTDLINADAIQKAIPGFNKIVKLVSSTPIRNLATIAGNFVNASPIGDFTIMFLALDAHIILSDGNNKRELPLRKFYKGYKQLDKLPNEYIETIWFELPAEGSLFNFEKVSKRTHLDIASVNTAICITVNGQLIMQASISAGGVNAVPTYLSATSAFLTGKVLTEELVEEATHIAQKEVSPISDARGSEAYKRLLLRQLMKAHFENVKCKIQKEDRRQQ